jgi:hypothetical protein
MHTHLPNKKSIPSQKSTSESSQPFISQPQNDAENVLALQQLIGNQATRQLLQPNPKSKLTKQIQREEQAPQPIVEDNDNVKRKGVGVLNDQPEMQAVLDELIPLAKSTANDFKSFREGGYESAANMGKLDQPTKALGKRYQRQIRDLLDCNTKSIQGGGRPKMKINGQAMIHPTS